MLSIIFAAGLVICGSAPALAQAGTFNLPNESSLTSPVTNQTVVFDQSIQQWVYWNGTAYVPTGGGAHPNFTAITAPTVSNDNTQGYSAGSLWLDTATGVTYVCISAATGAAVWNPQVSSIGISVPSWMSVSGSPITSGGTITLGTQTQPAGYFLASPSGSSGALSPRAIVASDLPLIPLSAGGTNANQSAAAGAVVYSTNSAFVTSGVGSAGQPLMSGGTSAPTFGTLGTNYGGTGLTATPSAGQIPIGTGSGYTLNTITAGNGIQINNGAGSVAISATGTPLPPLELPITTGFGTFGGLIVDASSTYAYLGGKITSDNHPAIAQIRLVDGSVRTVELSANNGSTSQLAISPDGSSVYSFFSDTTGSQWAKVATSTMTVTHSMALTAPETAPGGGPSGPQNWDISPDGSKMCYVVGTDQKVYLIDTSAYTQSNFTAGHSAGAADTQSVCFYDNADVLVAYHNNATIDDYAFAGSGTYNSSIATGALGTPLFVAMRVGFNGTVFIADWNNSQLISAVTGGGASSFFPLYLSPSYLSVDTTSDAAVNGGWDLCALTDGYDVYLARNQIFCAQVPINWYVNTNHIYGVAICADGSGRVFVQSGNAVTTLNETPAVTTTQQLVDAVGNVVLNHVTVKLTSTQLQNLHTSPVQILPAPGGSSTNIVYAWQFTMDRSATAYTSGGALGLQYHTGPVAVTNTVPATVLTTAGAATTVNVRHGIDADPQIVNDTVEITNASGNFATGTGTATVDVWYSTQYNP